MNEQNFRYSPACSAVSGFHDSTCWYCDHRIADGCRFCDKACAEAFEEDDLAVERRVLARHDGLRAAFV